MKMTVELVGPSKEITSKKTGNKLTIYQVKFKEDPNWTDLFNDTPPTPGQEFEGIVEKGPYGYTFKKERKAFPMRNTGYSDKQLAIQCAVRLPVKSTQEALEAARTILAWLEVPHTPPHTEQATGAENGSDEPPIENYSELGL